VIYATVPMSRNADLTLTVAVLATSGTDALVERAWSGILSRADRTGRIVRATKLVAFDVPVVWYFAGLNHELGHTTRAHEQGIRTRLRITGTPWSGRQFDLLALDPGASEDLGIQGGGLEASRRLKDVSERRMLHHKSVAPGYAVTAISGSIDVPLYAFWNLNPDKFNSPTRGFPAGDVGKFVRELVNRRGGADGDAFERARRQVRARTALNLLDFGLWTQTVGVFRDYIWNGDNGVPVRWLTIGRIDLIPAMRYELSPIGPEYYVRGHYRVSSRSGTAYLRWTERIGAERQTGVGFSVSGWRLHKLMPQADVDLWSHSTRGRGMHVAISTDIAEWPSTRAVLNMSIGAKSSGYLAGYPLDHQTYASAGFSIRLW
jgi:hypothetical protein